MWIVCITSVRHVLTVNGYGGRQTKENEKSWCFKGWETLVILLTCFMSYIVLLSSANIDKKSITNDRKQLLLSPKCMCLLIKKKVDQ